MYNLQSIDNGNSHPHVGFFKNGQLDFVSPLKEYMFDTEIDSIASSVGPSSNLSNLKYISLKKFREENSFLDMPVHYEMTLGEDRLHQGYYVYKNKRPGLTLLIDAGTFTTVDFIEEDGMKGGYIFPGIQTFLKSYSHGAELPSVGNSNSLIPDLDIPGSTKSAIENAMKYSQVAWLEKLLKEHQVNEIYLSGGNSSLFNEVLETTFKGAINFEKNLIHYSLYEIYLYLVKNNLKD